MIGALLSSIVVSSNAVSFTARATGVAVDVPLEFVFAEQGTAHDYETLFLTDDSLAELAAAFGRSGMPKGKPYDFAECRFWAEGPVVTLTPALDTLIRDLRGHPLAPIVVTGGNGRFEPMPKAMFATYNLGQSILRFDEMLDQSLEYGRFSPCRQFEKGEKFTFTVTWDGRRVEQAMTPDFPADKTLAEAVKVAKGLARVDSPETKIGGFKPGQFYYRAFLPEEKWRERSARLAQPLEIHVTSNDVGYVVIDEDWSGEGTEPVLSERRVSPAELNTLDRVDTCFIFASADTRLSRLYTIKAALPKHFINWYVFVD